MIFEISEEEKNLLLELIESAEETAIQSMDHADSRSFKSVLKAKLELLASAKEKIRGQGPPGGLIVDEFSRGGCQ